MIWLTRASVAVVSTPTARSGTMVEFVVFHYSTNKVMRSYSYALNVAFRIRCSLMAYLLKNKRGTQNNYRHSMFLLQNKRARILIILTTITITIYYKLYNNGSGDWCWCLKRIRIWKRSHSLDTNRWTYEHEFVGILFHTNIPGNAHTHTFTYSNTHTNVDISLAGNIGNYYPCIK